MKLKELEDYTWFPDILRRYQMDFIGFMVKKVGLYPPLFIKLQISQDTIYDLCSGSGGPAHTLSHIAQKRLVLSDKYPQDPLKVKQVDVLLHKFTPDYYYTMFNAFHHFDTPQQDLILSSLVDSRSEFLIVEILRPTLVDFIKILITTTLGQVVFTPFIRPFSLMRIICTYLVPINLITITIDGLISVVNSKSKAQYEQQINELGLKDNGINISLISTSKVNKVIVISNKTYT